MNDTYSIPDLADLGIVEDEDGEWNDETAEGQSDPLLMD